MDGLLKKLQKEPSNAKLWYNIATKLLLLQAEDSGVEKNASAAKTTTTIQVAKSILLSKQQPSSSSMAAQPGTTTTTNRSITNASDQQALITVTALDALCEAVVRDEWSTVISARALVQIGLLTEARSKDNNNNSGGEGVGSGTATISLDPSLHPFTRKPKMWNEALLPWLAAVPPTSTSRSSNGAAVDLSPLIALTCGCYLFELLWKESNMDNIVSSPLSSSLIADAPSSPIALPPAAAVYDHVGKELLRPTGGEVGTAFFHLGRMLAMYESSMALHGVSAGGGGASSSLSSSAVVVVAPFGGEMWSAERCLTFAVSQCEKTTTGDCERSVVHRAQAILFSRSVLQLENRQKEDEASVATPAVASTPILTTTKKLTSDSTERATVILSRCLRGQDDTSFAALCDECWLVGLRWYGLLIHHHLLNQRGGTRKTDGTSHLLLKQLEESTSLLVSSSTTVRTLMDPPQRPTQQRGGAEVEWTLTEDPSASPASPSPMRRRKSSVALPSSLVVSSSSLFPPPQHSHSSVLTLSLLDFALHLGRATRDTLRQNEGMLLVARVFHFMASQNTAGAAAGSALAAAASGVGGGSSSSSSAMRSGINNASSAIVYEHHVTRVLQLLDSLGVVTSSSQGGGEKDLELLLISPMIRYALRCGGGGGGGGGVCPSTSNTTTAAGAAVSTTTGQTAPPRQKRRRTIMLDASQLVPPTSAPSRKTDEDPSPQLPQEGSIGSIANISLLFAGVASHALPFLNVRPQSNDEWTSLRFLEEYVSREPHDPRGMIALANGLTDNAQQARVGEHRTTAVNRQTLLLLAEHELNVLRSTCGGRATGETRSCALIEELFGLGTPSSSPGSNRDEEGGGGDGIVEQSIIFIFLSTLTKSAAQRVAAFHFVLNVIEVVVLRMLFQTMNDFQSLSFGEERNTQSTAATSGLSRAEVLLKALAICDELEEATSPHALIVAVLLLPHHSVSSEIGHVYSELFQLMKRLGVTKIVVDDAAAESRGEGGTVSRTITMDYVVKKLHQLTPEKL